MNRIALTLQSAIDKGLPIQLVHDNSSIRIYNKFRETMFTFRLDDYTPALQNLFIDIIYPAL